MLLFRALNNEKKKTKFSCKYNENIGRELKRKKTTFANKKKKIEIAYNKRYQSPKIIIQFVNDIRTKTLRKKKFCNWEVIGDADRLLHGVLRKLKTIQNKICNLRGKQI